MVYGCLVATCQMKKKRSTKRYIVNLSFYWVRPYLEKESIIIGLFLSNFQHNNTWYFSRFEFNNFQNYPFEYYLVIKRIKTN